MTKRIALGLGALAAVFVWAQPAAATVLPPGGVVTPPPVESGTFTMLASTGIQTVNDNTGMQGIAEAQAGTFTGNPFGANDITFVFQIMDTAGQMEHVTDKSLAGAGVVIDVGIQDTSLAGFKAPTSQPVDAQLSPDGSIISFDFTPPPSNALTPGDVSWLLIVNTNQTTFTTGSMGVIDGGGVTLVGFSITPEPASMALVLAGLPFLALGRWVRRRK